MAKNTNNKKVVNKANDDLATNFIASLKELFINLLNTVINRLKDLGMDVTADDMKDLFLNGTDRMNQKFEDTIARPYKDLGIAGRPLLDQARNAYADIMKDFRPDGAWSRILFDGRRLQDPSLWDFVTFADGTFQITPEDEARIRESFVEYVTTPEAEEFLRIHTAISKDIQDLYDLFAGRRSPSFLISPIMILSGLLEIRDQDKVRVSMKSIDYEGAFRLDL